MARKRYYSKSRGRKVYKKSGRLKNGTRWYTRRQGNVTQTTWVKRGRRK